MVLRGRWSVGLAVAIGLVHCTYGDGIDEVPIVRDSAGVEIVANVGRGSWTAGTRLQLSAEPVVQFGDALGGEFAFDRVSDVLFVDDSLFIVANQGSGQLVFVSSGGDRRYTVGRSGSGPGEFDRLTAIGMLPSGYLATFDSGHRRMSVFEVGGELVRTVPLEIGLQRGVGTMGIGWLDSGTFVARLLGSAGKTATAEIGKWRLMDSWAELVLFDDDGMALRIPVRTPGDQRLSMLTAREGSEYTIIGLPNPFLRSFVADAQRDRVAFGHTADDEIHILDSDGNLVRIIRRNRLGRGLATGMRNEWIDYRVAGIRDERSRRRRRQQYESMPFPSILPAFRSVVLDEKGRRLWVEEFELGAITSRGETHWSVYAEDGHLLGEVAMPSGFEVLRIGGDYVLGLWKDDLGVEYVQMYELVVG